MHAQRRSFLLLQGPCTPFFQRLAQRLVRRGHRITLVNFNGGDCLYRYGLRGHAFRGTAEELPAFFADLWSRYHITDQLMFGDRRPIHRPALQGAASHGVRSHVFEEGYLRPFWITLERDGVNAHSLLPRDPGWFRAVAARLDPPRCDTRFHSSFKVRAIHDVAYHLAGLVNPLMFSHYRNHAPVTAPLEYAGYLKRFSQLYLQRRRTQDARAIARLADAGAAYFVLPLQLNGDAQIRDHSEFSDMRDVIDRVMASFAQHAPSTARLVIKNHPLDMGLINYAAYIKRLAAQLGIRQRVIYLETGDLNRLLPHASGMVTVNSTAGLVALAHHCPTLALSDAIYAIPGLICSAPLDGFWRNPTPPNRELFHSFRRVLRHCTQLNGGFYCRTGIELAVANSVAQLEADRSPLEELLECLPSAA